MLLLNMHKKLVNRFKSLGQVVPYPRYEEDILRCLGFAGRRGPLNTHLAQPFWTKANLLGGGDAKLRASTWKR
jgi:hypothetical protein